MRGWTMGLIAVALATAVTAVALLVAAGRGGGVAIVDLEVGDCFDLPDGERDADVLRLETVDLIDCADPHDAEVVLVGTLNPDGERSYPSDAELFDEIDRRCDPEVGDPEDFGLLPIAPDEATWTTFDGHFACVILPIGGGPVTGSAVAASG